MQAVTREAFERSIIKMMVGVIGIDGKHFRTRQIAGRVPQLFAVTGQRQPFGVDTFLKLGAQAKSDDAVVVHLAMGGRMHLHIELIILLKVAF